MLDVVVCVFEKHNLWLVLLAALICAFSVGTTLTAFDRGLNNIGAARSRWLALAGAVGGAGVWATHFVAMLAYSPDLPIRFGVPGTLASLLIGMIGAGLGFTVAANRQGGPLLGGALVGAAVIALHYSGIAAIQAAFRLHWNLAFVAASIVLSLAGATAAVWTQMHRPGLKGRIGAGVLLLLGIVGLHFTGMTAVSLTPDLSATLSPELLSRPVLAVLVCAMVVLILVVAVALILVETQSRRVSLGAVESAFQAMPSGTALYDADGALVLWNEAFADLMQSFGVTLHRGMDRTQLMQSAVDGAAASVGGGRIAFQDTVDAPLANWEGETPDGRWLRVERKLIKGGALIAVMSDVTHLRRWAEAMQEARDKAEAASRAKSDFLANMSHEIRTPLNGVLGMIQAMQRDALSPAQRQRVEVAHESGRALLGTLNDILDLAKVQAGRMELEASPFEVAELGEAVCKAFAGAAAVKGLALDLVVDEAARGWRLGDALKLRQILSNLVANGLKFTQHGGVVLAVGEEAGRLVFKVRDTGIGIDPRDAERLFEKFAQADSSTTRKFGGTGLGLAICRELTELMGGEIQVESTPGEGACFTVSIALPRTDAPETAVQAMAAAETEALDTERSLQVLVAEDNPVNQAVLRALMEPVDAEISMVGNGEQAVEAFRAGAFDLVLMDIQMPEMNGVEATRIIRALELAEGRARTPIIALTANVMRDQLEDYASAGMDDHVAKPIEIDRLYAAIAAVLEPDGPTGEQAAA